MNKQTTNTSSVVKPELREKGTKEEVQGGDAPKTESVQNNQKEEVITIFEKKIYKDNNEFEEENDNHIPPQKNTEEEMREKDKALKKIMSDKQYKKYREQKRNERKEKKSEKRNKKRHEKRIRLKEQGNSLDKQFRRIENKTSFKKELDEYKSSNGEEEQAVEQIEEEPKGLVVKLKENEIVEPSAPPMPINLYDEIQELPNWGAELNTTFDANLNIGKYNMQHLDAISTMLMNKNLKSLHESINKNLKATERVLDIIGKFNNILENRKILEAMIHDYQTQLVEEDFDDEGKERMNKAISNMIDDLEKVQVVEDHYKLVDGKIVELDTTVEIKNKPRSIYVGNNTIKYPPAMPQVANVNARADYCELGVSNIIKEKHVYFTGANDSHIANFQLNKTLDRAIDFDFTRRYLFFSLFQLPSFETSEIAQLLINNSTNGSLLSLEPNFDVSLKRFCKNPYTKKHDLSFTYSINTKLATGTNLVNLPKHEYINTTSCFINGNDAIIHKCDPFKYERTTRYHAQVEIDLTTYNYLSRIMGYDFISDCDILRLRIHNKIRVGVTLARILLNRGPDYKLYSYSFVTPKQTYKPDSPFSKSVISVEWSVNNFYLVHKKDATNGDLSPNMLVEIPRDIIHRLRNMVNNKKVGPDLVSQMTASLTNFLMASQPRSTYDLETMDEIQNNAATIVQEFLLANDPNLVKVNKRTSTFNFQKVLKHIKTFQDGSLLPPGVIKYFLLGLLALVVMAASLSYLLIFILQPSYLTKYPWIHLCSIPAIIFALIAIISISTGAGKLVWFAVIKQVASADNNFILTTVPLPVMLNIIFLTVIVILISWEIFRFFYKRKAVNNLSIFLNAYYARIFQQTGNYSFKRPIMLRGFTFPYIPGKYKQRTDAKITKIGEPKTVKDVYQLPDNLVLTGLAFTRNLLFVHSNTQENLITALEARVGLDYGTKVRDQDFTTKLCDWVYNEYLHNRIVINDKGFAPQVDDDLDPYENYTWEQFLEHYPPRKRSLILRAMESYKLRPMDRFDFRSSVFLKCEKTEGPLSEDEIKAARVISAVDEALKAMTCLPFKDLAVTFKHIFNRKTNIFYCSGKTLTEINEVVQKMYDMGEVVYIMGDFSKYDMTQALFHIQYENKFLRKIHFEDVVKKQKHMDFSGIDMEEFYAAYEHMKISNRPLSVSMEQDGVRKSGSPQTSVFNSFWCFNFWLSFFLFYGFTNLEFILMFLGDDNFSCVTKASMIRIFGDLQNMRDAIANWAKNFGFILKFLVSENIYDMEFLSMIPYVVNQKIYMGRKVARVMMRSAWFLYDVTTKDLTNDQWLQVWKGSIISNLPAANHVPFLRIYYNTILNRLSKVQAKFIESTEEVQVLTKDCEIVDTAMDTWDFFTSRYGLGQLDEIRFANELEEHISKYGLMSLWDCDWINLLKSGEPDII